MYDSDKILEAINGLKDQIHDVQLKAADTNTKVSLIQKGQETTDRTILDHTYVLYGDPKKMGVGGLIHKQSDQDRDISGIKTDIKNLRGFFAIFWTGIITGFNLLVNILTKRI